MNAAPVLGGVESSALSYDTGSGPANVTSTITVTDMDSTNLNGATVRISSGYENGHDTLSFTDQNGITGSWDSTSGTLTLSGTASKDDYQTALRDVQYSASDPTPSGSRTVEFQVDDGQAQNHASNTVSRNITINHVNHAPVVTNDTSSTDEDHATSPINVLGNDSDVDGDTLHVASVDTTGTKGSVTINSDNTITYDPNKQFESLGQGQTDTDTFTYKANDGTTDSNSATVTVKITGVNDAPVLGNVEGTALAYSSDQPATAISSTITVNDVDSTNLTGATVQITTGYVNGKDTLSFTNQNGISGIFDANSGTLTLSGSSSVVNYQTALRSVKFQGDNATGTKTASRTISFQVDDGAAQNHASTTVTRNIDVTHVNQAPVAGTDTFNGTNSALSNTTLAVSTSPSGPKVSITGNLLTNDTDAETPHQNLTATQETNKATTNGGSVDINSDGTVTYRPPPGFTGNDTFTYTVNDNDQTDPETATGTVNVNVVGPRVWYVDNSQSSAGNGTSASPFNSLGPLTTGGAADGLDGTGDVIFVYQGNSNTSGSEYGGIVLENSQSLVGQPQGLTVTDMAGRTDSLVSPGGSNPNLKTTSGDTITLANGNTLQALNVTGAGSSGISGRSGFGTLNVANVGITGSNQALNLNNGTLSGSGFTQLSSTGGASNVSLTSVGTSGTPALGTSSDALSGASSDAFKINGGGGSFTYAGKISNTSTLAVNVTSKTGGTVTFSGDINPTTAGKGISVSENKTGTNTITFSGANKKISTGSGTGVSLSNNTGATINFTNGGLAVTGTSNAAGFSATGGGTVNVQGSNNTIGTDTGTALNVANNTNIGSSGLTFKSISAGNNSNGPTNGIVLNNTGTSGGLTVTGGGNASVGGDSSGGTIQHTSNYGISLTSTLSPSFTNINIHDTGHNGIDGTDVTNFTFANGQISNTGTAAEGQYEENSIAFVDKGTPFDADTLDGAVSITGSSISQPHRNALMIETWNGTISNLNISNNTLSGGTTTSSIADAIHVLTQGSASTTANLTTGTIQNNTISGFEFFDSSSGKYIGGSGIFMGGGSGNLSNSAPATFGTQANPVAITGNKISDMGSNAIATSFNGVAGSSYVNIANNGTQANPINNVEGLGISALFAGGNTFTGATTVDNNWIDTNGPTVKAGSSGMAVQLESVDSNAANNTPSGAFTITNNHVLHPDGNSIRALVRNSNATGKLKIQNNTVGAPSLPARFGIRVDGGSSLGNTTTCLNISGNTATSNGSNPGIGLRKQGTDQNVNTFGINGLSPSPATAAQTEDYVSRLNPASALGTSSDGTQKRTLVLNGSNYVSCSLP